MRATRGVGLAEVMVTASLSLLVAGLAYFFFQTSFHRALRIEMAATRQRSILQALDRMMLLIRASAPEGVRCYEKAIAIATQTDSPDTQRRWHPGWTGYHLSSSRLLRADFRASETALTAPLLPDLASLRSAPAVGFPGVTDFVPSLEGTSVRVELTFEGLKSDGGVELIKLVRWGDFSL